MVLSVGITRWQHTIRNWAVWAKTPPPGGTPRPATRSSTATGVANRENSILWPAPKGSSCSSRSRHARAGDTARGFDAVNHSKQRRLRRLASNWLAANRRNRSMSGYATDLRFDVVDVDARGHVRVTARLFLDSRGDSVGLSSGCGGWSSSHDASDAEGRVRREEPPPGDPHPGKMSRPQPGHT